jgi:hypothetical protein
MREMKIKTVTLFPAAKKSATMFHGIDSSRRLTKVFRNSLKSSWLHMYIRCRKFVRDYSLPVIVTVAFLFIALGISVLRAAARSSVAGLLANVTTTSEDYARLTSHDNTKQPERSNEPDQASPQTPAGSPSSFAINSGGVTAAPDTPGGSEVAPAFAVSIIGFQHTTTEVVCTTPKPKPQTCSKRYVFSATIRTQNGPGTVNYGWRSNLQEAVTESSFAVAGGQTETPLNKEITLACTVPADFGLQLVVTSPTAVQSTTINTNHNCNDM